MIALFFLALACAEQAASTDGLCFEHTSGFDVQLVERELSRSVDGKEELLERPLPAWTWARRRELAWRDRAGLRTFERLLCRDRRGGAEREQVEQVEQATSPLVGRQVRFRDSGPVPADAGDAPLPAGLQAADGLAGLVPPAALRGASRWTLDAAALAPLLFPGGDLGFDAELDARAAAARASLTGELAAEVRERDASRLRVELTGELHFTLQEREEVASAPGVSGWLTRAEEHRLELSGELVVDLARGQASSVELAGSLELERRDVRTLGGERGEFESVLWHLFRGTFELEARHLVLEEGVLEEGVLGECR